MQLSRSDKPLKMAHNGAMNLQALIELSRGDTPECLHFGAVALVDTQGRVLAQVGDPYWRTFSRSTLKALQALPLVRGGGIQHFGLNSQNLALLCASHSGEAMHVAQTQAILDKAGVPYQRLQCGCHVPGYLLFHDKAAPDDLRYDERHHNCSGKHAGFLAYCAQHGLDQATYLEPSHPLQQAIRQQVALATGLPESDLAMGIDGCSAPNYALPLAHLARAYARLASASNPGADDPLAESLAPLGQAMTAHPELVSGTGRNDLAFMQAGRGDWVTKVGADGVQVVASRARGQALAIKISDGNKPALFAATVEVLDQLGWLDAAQRAELQVWRSAALLNVRGTPVGARRPVFQLQRPN